LHPHVPTVIVCIAKSPCRPLSESEPGPPTPLGGLANQTLLCETARPHSLRNEGTSEFRFFTTPFPQKGEIPWPAPLRSSSRISSRQRLCRDRRAKSGTQ